MTIAAPGLPQLKSGSLVLVNAAHACRAATPDGLVPVSRRHPDILLCREAADALRAALDFVGAGERIVPVSGYRPHSEQVQLYNDSLRDNGEAFTRRFVALPGHSEHETGLAIDLGLASDSIDFIRPDFPYEGICQRFREAVADFGFVERYAADKQDVTGIAHEPWHFRYVGCPHARIMAENHLALEEYTDYIKRARADIRLACGEYEVFYLSVSESDRAAILPDESTSVSGNNVDGFVVTVRRRT